MKKASVAVISMGASALALAASSNVEINVKKDIVDQELSDYLLSSSGFLEKDTVSAIYSSIESIGKNLKEDGESVIDFEKSQLLAKLSNQDSRSIISKSARQCYSNCHSACHGSRQWR